MNMKEKLEKDFLRLQKVLRELRFLRYNNLQNPENKRRIEESIKLLGPMSDELKASWDKPTDLLILHRAESSKLQSLTKQTADKVKLVNVTYN